MATRVLILEPDEDLLSAIVAYIRRATDFDCEGTTTGKQCIEKLKHFRPDVLVMEPSLPGESSGDVLDAVANMSARAFIPVLVLTRMSRDAITTYHKSIAEFLIKPQTLTDIVEAVRRRAATR